MTKRTTYYYLPLILALSIPSTICNANQFEDEFDSFSLFDDPALNDYVDHTEFNLHKANNPADPASCLIDIGAATILQEPLFLHTNPFVSRSLLDLPLFLPERYYELCWTVGSHLFYNQTSRETFAGRSSAICSYLAIQSPTLLENLNKCADPLSSLIPLSPSDLLSLFKNATVTERRTGFMFHAQRQWENYRFRWMAPFYYLERNFFLTEAEQERIEETLGKASEDEVELLAKQHLISDKIGVGDTRLTFDARVYESENFECILGVLATLPTAFTIGKSFLGSEFHKVVCRPKLDIEALFFQFQSKDKIQKEKAQDIVKKFAFGVLDNLAANLLDVELGDYQHVGLGGYYETKTQLSKFLKIPWAQNFTVRTRASIEYLFPKTESRWFVECSNAQLFEDLDLNRSIEAISDQIHEDPAYAQAVLTLLEEQLIDRLYPFTFKTRVSPGVILHSTTKFFYEVSSWGYFLGNDFWLASAEKLKDIRICRESANRPPNIDIFKATKQRAYESKIIGGVFWKVNRPDHEWLLSLNADTTYYSSRIGDNFNLTFDVEVNF